MKRISKMTVIFLIAFFALESFAGCSKDDNNDTLQGVELSESEKDGLLLMREEEKLARDVYLTLNQSWNLRVLGNIANSEQTHMQAVKTLLDQYKIEDPVKSDEIGVFTSSKLSQLYKDLVTKGKKSLLDALVIGATIEDLDIHDLNTLLAETPNKDILLVYNNLNRGSRNHIRAFTAQIKLNGGTYTPQYISEDEYTQIVNSEMERGGRR